MTQMRPTLLGIDGIEKQYKVPKTNQKRTKRWVTYNPKG